VCVLQCNVCVAVWCIWYMRCCVMSMMWCNVMS